MSWREGIAAARKRGRFTKTEMNKTAILWTTCAVGEQAAKGIGLTVNPVRWLGRDDNELVSIGSAFVGRVNYDDFDGAESLLDAIEDRVLQLKREAKS
jgi:hypothetical protein